MAIEQKLSLGTRAAWLVGSAPEMIKNTSWDLFVLFYYTQVVGLSGSLIGVALAIILALDAIVDPYVGAFSDSLKRAPLGRRHTVMLAGTLPFAIGFAAVFSPPQGLDQSGLFAWLLAFGSMARIGISLYTVPAFAVSAELSRHPKERALVVSLRNIGANFGMLAVTVLSFRLFFTATPDYPKGQLNPEPYPIFGLSFAALGLFCMAVGIFGTMRTLRASERAEGGVVGGSRLPRPGLVLRELLESLSTGIRVTPNVRRLLTLSLLVSLINAVLFGLTLHLATYLWQFNPEQSEQLLVFGMGGSLLGYFTAAPIIARFRRLDIMVVCLLGFFCCSLLAVGLPVLGLAPPAGSSALATLITLLRFVGGLCYGWYLVATGSTSLDITDEHHVNMGRPQQGTVMSLVFVGMQAAGAIAGILSGIFLDLIEFPRGLAPDAMPADKPLALAIFICTIIIATGSLLSAVIRSLEISPTKQAYINERLAALRSPKTGA
jgi:glycoside/pentoside/hexuronide:cation symporter, GPH family